MVNQNFRLKMRVLLFSALALGLALAGCGGELQSGAESGGTSGILTVIDCPPSGFVYIHARDVPTTQPELSDITTGYIAIGTPESEITYPLRKMDYSLPQTPPELSGVAAGHIAIGAPNSATSYPLMGNTGVTFTGSGDFLVVLIIGQNSYCKKVSFSYGSGTVDYNNMTLLQ